MIKKYRYIILLNVLLIMYSMGGIFSKEASNYEFLSPKFIICYGGLILILAIYALVWQQIIKRMPLTVAYANKAITVVWGVLWGVLFFDEKVSIVQIIGAMIVIIGVIIYTCTDDSIKN